MFLCLWAPAGRLSCCTSLLGTFWSSSQNSSRTRNAWKVCRGPHVPNPYSVVVEILCFPFCIVMSSSNAKVCGNGGKMESI